VPLIALVRLWKPAVLGLLLAGIFTYRAILVHQRDSARKQVAGLTVEADELLASNSKLLSSINDQNSALDEMHQEMTAAQQAAAQSQAASVREAAATMGKYEAAANAMNQARVPADCEGAIEWGNAQGPELGQW
jgi:hypothetical protein